VFGDSLDICYFCDAECQTILRRTMGSANGADLYTTALTGAIAKLLKQVDPLINARMLLTIKHNTAVNLAWFNRNDHSQEALANANAGLWGDMTGLFSNAQKAGCDMAIALFYDDSSFDYSGVIGIANMMQICDDMAYAVVKLYPTSPSRQMAITAHEIGHILGMYHDFEMEPQYEKPMMREMFPEEIAAMERWCVDDENSGCEDTVADRCIMHETPVGGAVMPTMFSKCSIANYNMYRSLSVVAPTMYERDCFLTHAPADFDDSSILE